MRRDAGGMRCGHRSHCGVTWSLSRVFGREEGKKSLGIVRFLEKEIVSSLDVG